MNRENLQRLDKLNTNRKMGAGKTFKELDQIAEKAPDVNEIWQLVEAAEQIDEPYSSLDEELVEA